MRIGMHPGSGFVATIGNDATHPKRSKSALSLPQPIAGARTHRRLLGGQRRRRVRGWGIEQIVRARSRTSFGGRLWRRGIAEAMPLEGRRGGVSPLSSAAPEGARSLGEGPPGSLGFREIRISC